MNRKIVKTIFKKELLETLRDKRTLVAMLGVPIVLYPLMIILIGQVTTIQQTMVETKMSKVGMPADSPEILRLWISSVEKVMVVDVDTNDPNDRILSGQINAYVYTSAQLDDILNHNGTAKIEISYDVTEDDSKKAVQRIVARLNEQGQEILLKRLESKGLKEEFTKPFSIGKKNIASSRKLTGSMLGMVLPGIMIIMLGTGAFYPAVDLTAGEKERGTFETLLSTPISKADIICGKFITVFCLCMITGLLSLGSMTFSLTFQISQMAAAMPENSKIDISMISISPATVFIIFLTLIPLAFFICSVMMSIAIIARDFKEAQNYVTPFFIAIMFPAMIAMVPGVELTRITMFIPIANVALLFKDLLIGQMQPDQIFAVISSTAAYALGSLIIAVKLFQQEDVVLAEDKGLPLSFKRSEFLPRDYPTVGFGLLMFTVCLLLMFYAGTYVQLRWIIPGLILSQWLLLLIPSIGTLWYTRVNIRKTLSLKIPHAGFITGIIIIFMGTYFLTLQMTFWQNKILPTPETMSEQMQKIFDEGQSLPGFILLVLAIGISPAICEEVLFRGVILSSLRSKISAFWAILISSVLFGIMHQNVYMLMHTTLLGLIMGYIVVRSGSIIPSMIFHFLVNTSTVILSAGYLPDSIGEYFKKWDEAKSFPPELIITCLLLSIAGFVIVELTSRSLKNNGH